VATGTGGTITGTGKYLKEKNPAIQLWAIDSYGSLLKKFHETGELDMSEVYPYITEGIGEDFVPQNYDMALIDHFEKVTDKDGAVMARRISKEEGIFVGYSAGSAIAGLQQLKSRLKPTDLVVVIFHDHGSRYVGKVYNDQWMMERGFLDVKTVKDVVNARRNQPLVTVKPEDKVSDVIVKMKKYDIEQIPVLHNNEIVGSISENGLFIRLIDDANLKDAQVKQVMQAAFPEVSMDTPIEKLSAYINKENGAVLTKDDSGNYHIVTKYDIIQALGN
jgi:cystathionine beta-synthase